MRYCDLTLPTPQENLACDEALLDLCEGRGGQGILRFWEPTQYFVVVGYANAVNTEVNIAFCREHGIPILRRCTGGGTVLQGPGCLNYSLFLPVESDGPLQSISATNDFILQKHQETLAALLQAPVEKQGHTDLAIGGLKFSGNAQRRRKNFLLFHGAFLLDLDISLVQQVLPLPSQQPDYRFSRSHTDFLMNLKTPSHLLKASLRRAWNATEPLAQIPFRETAALIAERYGREDWNFKF